MPQGQWATTGFFKLAGAQNRIKQLGIQQNGGMAPMPMLRAGAAKFADAAPIEAGESVLSTTVSGQIELLE